MSNPAVSVILPVYNGANYVRFAVESVLNQTFRDFELIVVDDGSTDETPEIIRSYGSRLRYVRKENGGVATAFNRGIEESSGQYISWLSHDDAYHEAKLEKQLEAVRAYPGPAVCYTDVEFIDGRGEVTRALELPEYPRGEVLRHLVTGGVVSNAAYSIFYDRRCVEEVGAYVETQRYTQDADMLIRLVRRFPFVHVPEKLIKVREHAERSSKDTAWLTEAKAFHKEWLDRLGVEELFPELKGQESGAARARARMWLGDAFAGRERAPFWHVPLAEYRKAAGESPLAAPALAARMARLGWMHLGINAERYYRFFRTGLGPTLARKLGLAK
jgi:glycosyltransferase involved in cell wall biosynthesis